MKLVLFFPSSFTLLHIRLRAKIPLKLYRTMPMHGKYARELGWKYSVLLPKKGIITSSNHSVVVEKLREKDVGTLTILVCVFQEKVE